MTYTQSTAAAPMAMSVQEFCQSIGISSRTFYNLAERGEAPPTVNIGRRVVIRVQAAEKWLADREAAGNAAV